MTKKIFAVVQLKAIPGVPVPARLIRACHLEEVEAYLMKGLAVVQATEHDIERLILDGIEIEDARA